MAMMSLYQDNGVKIRWAAHLRARIPFERDLIWEDGEMKNKSFFWAKKNYLIYKNPMKGGSTVMNEQLHR